MIINPAREPSPISPPHEILISSPICNTRNIVFSADESKLNNTVSPIKCLELTCLESRLPSKCTVLHNRVMRRLLQGDRQRQAFPHEVSCANDCLDAASAGTFLTCILTVTKLCTLLVCSLTSLKDWSQLNVFQRYVRSLARGSCCSSQAELVKLPVRQPVSSKALVLNAVRCSSSRVISHFCVMAAGVPAEYLKLLE